MNLKPLSPNNPPPEEASPLASGVYLAATGNPVPSNPLSEAKRLREIALMTSGIVGTMPLQEQAALLAEKVQAAFAADACVIRVLEYDQLRLLACSGYVAGSLPEQVSPSFGVAPMVIGEKKPVFISDVRTHPTTAYIAKEDPSKLLSYAGAPLLAESMVIGIIGVYWKQTVPHFSKNDLEHLQIVANHISVSIANDRLYHELQSQKEQLEHQMAERSKAERRNQAFSLLSQQLTAVRTDREVAETILNIAGPLIGWDAAYMCRYSPQSRNKTTVIRYDTLHGKKTLIGPFRQFKGSGGRKSQADPSAESRGQRRAEALWKRVPQVRFHSDSSGSAP